MITAWILMTYVSYYTGFQYSTPVATQESCEIMKTVAMSKGKGKGSWEIFSCVKVEIHK